MKKIYILLVAMLFAGCIFGQQKVAIYVDKEVEKGIDETLRHQLTTAFKRHRDKYIPVERQITYLDVVKEEICYQNSGFVDDDKIACVGKQLGADIVCICKVTELRGELVIFVRLVDVVSVEIIESVRQIVENTSPNAKEIDENCEMLAVKLVGESKTEKTSKTASLSINSNPSSADVYVNGEKKGYTPLILNDVAAQKEVKIEIKKEGYESYTTNITTQAGKTENVYGTLKEMSKSNINNIEMVFVKGGTFTMGCTSKQSDCYSDEKPTHQVTLNDYYIGKYEVTQKQWKDVMGSNPSSNKGCDECPAEKVSWNDIQEFIKKLNEKTGKKYRLPTEAEWEYAARGGASSAHYKYSGSNNIDEVAWYKSNSTSKTHPVGTKKANELGIYDMSGNVWEWCSDWYDAYSSNSQTNPTGAVSGSGRVLRGGSWSNLAQYCGVSCRGDGTPRYRGDDLGFRLALVP